MKKLKLFVITTCCATLLFSSCSNMLESLDKASEPKGAEKPKVVSYTVEHWQQNIADDDYTKVVKDTQTLSGKIGEKTKAAAKTYTGFTAKAFEQKTLSTAETSIIKIFYDRKIITYSFDAAGGTWGQGATDNVKVYKGKYGASFEASPDDATTTAPTLHPEKNVSNIIYTFTGWDKAVPASFGEKDLSFTAQWSTSKYLYKVEHYLQNITDNDYTQDGETSTQNFASVIENPADIPNNLTKDYAGFTFKEATISGGELIKIYYDRKITALTLNPNGGKFYDGSPQPETFNKKYGSTFTINMGEVLWPAREGYEFRGWAYTSDATKSDFSQELNFEITDVTPSTVTLYAFWRPEPVYNAAVYLTVQNQPWNDSGCELKVVKNGKAYTLQAGSNSNTYTASLPAGTYDIYNSTVDTSVDLIIDSQDSSATINYDNITKFATVDTFADVISSLTDDVTIVVAGELDDSRLNTISNAIKDSNYNINLDLSNSTGLYHLPRNIFNLCSKLIRIKLPVSISSINPYAFKESGLIELPSSLKYIDSYAFSGCTSFESIVIPDSVIYIKSGAFKECTNLKSIEIPSSVIRIEVGAFRGCTSLESIVIPDSVTTIGDEVFCKCTSLKSIEIPNSVTSIGESVFERCTNLKSIEIPCSVTHIASNAFRGCTNLKTINYAGTQSQWDAITKGEHWNHGCPTDIVINFNCVKATVDNIAEIIAGLTSDATIIMSGTVTNENIATIRNAIDNSAYNINLDLTSTTGLTAFTSADFSYLRKLTGITIPISVTSIGSNSFERCDNLKNIKIPNSLTSIESCVFSCCAELLYVILPDTITSIGRESFYRCEKLESVEIPISVTSIGSSAFSYCSKLETINYAGTEEQWYDIIKGENWDYACPSTMVINFNCQGE